MKTYLLIVLASAAVSAAVFTGLDAAAQERAIRQAGSQFGPQRMAVRVGEELLFINDDTIAHNVYSQTAGNQFNLGLMRPGSTTAHQFAAAGVIEVRCGIHPRMRAEVTVTN